MLDTITKQRGDGHLSMTEESWHWDRAAHATDQLLALLIERHSDNQDWYKYSSRQIAKLPKPAPVPTEIPNPAPSDTASDGLALRLIAEPGACGAPVSTAPPEPRYPRVEEIQRAVALHYGIDRHDMISSRRTANIVRPRQVAMYLSKILTLRSLPEIGRRFGNRDHSTILHGVRKIANLVQSDQHLAAEIGAIRHLLGAADMMVAA